MSTFIRLVFALGLFLRADFSAQGAYLDFSQPAREAALGGNGVALPEGTSDLIFNPAGLGDEYRFQVSARYENLFTGIEGDDLSTGNLSAIFPIPGGDAFGLSVDHFGSENLQQDRLSVSFGKSFPVSSVLYPFRLGVSVSYLRQQFTLSAPLPGVNPSNISAGDFSVGAGFLWDPVRWATLGFSAEDLNEPNLGVVGVDRVPLLWRYGLAVRPSVGEDRLSLTLAQSLDEGLFETQAGAEWTFMRSGFSLRAGGDTHAGAVGLGWRSSGLTIDYTYQFSWNEAPSLGGVGLPGSHLVQIGFSWENASREGMVYDSLIYKGKEAEKALRWKEAFWYYQQAYFLKPSEPVVLAGRDRSLGQYNRQRAKEYFEDGQTAEKTGYFREAQRDYDWALSLCPDEKTYSENRDRVKKSITQGALGDPRVQTLLEKSVSLFKKGEKSAALRRIKEAKAIYPKDSFLNFMAKAFADHKSGGVADKNLDLERMAVEAEIYRSKGRLDLAKKTWEKMMAADPGNVMASENLTEDEMGSGSPLPEADQKRAQALLQRGLRAYVNGEVDAAVKDWEEVLTIDPRNVNALNNLTRVKMDEGEGMK